MSDRLPPALLALIAYLAVSVAVFGHAVLGDPQHIVEGSFGRDQSAFVWNLAWLARSVSHLHNPFLTHEVFAPSGYNLAWSASMFGPGLLVVPVSLSLGPVASFNLLALAAPATAAWTAFLLCRHVSGSALASFAGGLLYGFGPYEAGEMIDHLPLALSALPPLAALLVLRRHSGKTGRWHYALLLGVVLALQLWIDTEVLASMVLFGLLALLLVALLSARPDRARLRATAGDTLLALPVAVLLVTPLLVFVIGYPNPVSGIKGGEAGTDLANFVIPTTATWLHGTGAIARAAARMRGNVSEQLAYLGIPLVLVMVAFAMEFRRRTVGRFLLALIAASLLLSLGAHLYLDGDRSSVVLPWYPFSLMPVLRLAIPGRFVLYTWLAIAVAVSYWLSQPSHSWVRWGAFAVSAIFLAPNLAARWGTRVDEPALLRGSSLAREVPLRSTVLALPFGIAGNSMYWQVEAGFRFRLAGGYLSPSLPRAYQPYRHLIATLEGKSSRRPLGGVFCRFLQATGTRVILLREHVPGPWGAVLGPLKLQPKHDGGFTVYGLTRSAMPRACQRSG